MESVSETLQRDSFQQMQAQGMGLIPQLDVWRPAMTRDFCSPEFNMDTNVGAGMMPLPRTG